MPVTTSESWILGSSPQSNIRLQARGIAPLHCRLTRFPEGAALEDLGSETGTEVNGKRLIPYHALWVNPSDQILLAGTIPFPWHRLQEPAPAAPGVAAATVRIGKGPENDVQLDFPMISRKHARLTCDESGSWFIEDAGSLNGTFLNSFDHRVISREPLRAEDQVYLGSFKIAASRLMEQPAKARKTTIGICGGEMESIRFAGRTMTLGRDPESDQVLQHPTVSWRHAQIERAGDGIYIRDLGSRHGTFVNGERVRDRVRLEPGKSEVELGRFRFLFLDGGVIRKFDDSDNIAIQVANLEVTVPNGTVLIEDVSLTVLPGELVALMGASGCGKTTLMLAMNGYTAPSKGSVLFNGVDLHSQFDRFRQLIGYVPQDDVMHPQLTVYETLAAAARLRTDLNDEQIHERVCAVLEDLDMPEIAGCLIGSVEEKTISGGQRKRVSIAMELLNDPSVLFLDEPTSGLSAKDALKVVELLRKLADRGKTVVTTIHQPELEIYERFDNLAMMHRDLKAPPPGRLVYYGPAMQALEFFVRTAHRTPFWMIVGVDARSCNEWVSDFANSKFHRIYVRERATDASPPRNEFAQPIARPPALGQWVTLAARYAKIKLRDRAQTGLLLAQAPILGALIALGFPALKDQVFTDAHDWAKFTQKLDSVQFLLVMASVWFGCNNAVREIVGESAIFRRERMVSLNLSSYVGSKAAILGALCAGQCLVLLSIVYFRCSLSAPFGTLFVILLCASVGALALGLAISALVKTSEAAIALLPLALLPMMFFSGGVIPLPDLSPPLRVVSNAFLTRWAYEAAVLAEAHERKAEYAPKRVCDPHATQPGVKLGMPYSAPRGGLPPCPSGLTLPEPENDIAKAAFDPAKTKRHTLRESLASLLGLQVVSWVAVFVSLRKKDLR